MYFPELVEKVMTETNRPDLIKETQNAIQAATMWAHTLDYWYKDSVAAFAEFNVQQHNQILDVSTIDRFRAISYVRRNPDENKYGFSRPVGSWWLEHNPVFMQRVDPDDILDDFRLYRKNVYFQMGYSLYMRADIPFRTALLGYYTYPNTHLANNGQNFNSWIAAENPYIIIYYATASIFNKIGDETQAAIYMKPPADQGGEYGGMIADFLRNLRLSNVIPNGA